jgi:hypothetical protein
MYSASQQFIQHVGVFIVTLILFRVEVTSNVHLLDFNKIILILCIICVCICVRNYYHQAATQLQLNIYHIVYTYIIYHHKEAKAKLIGP